MRAKNITHLQLPGLVKKMAKTAAAARGTSLTRYVVDLIQADCETSGIARLVVPQGRKEVQS